MDDAMDNRINRKMKDNEMNGKRAYGMKAIFVVAIASIIAGVALTVGLDLTETTTAQNFWKEARHRAEAPAGAPNFVELARRLTPAVVNISTTQVIKGRPLMPFPEFKGPFEDFFGDEFKRFFEEPQREFKRQSLGSGFIINKEGYILTNNHVIDDATEIIVTLAESKEEYSAEVVGADKNLDIALIKIDADMDLPVVTLGDSDALQVGEWVMAIGNPFGLGGTVTAGIVSQKGRVIGSGPYDNFIQTDASINPGNSGGPLFSLDGEVVGINTAIIAGGQGIGFATPINMVKDVLLQLKETGHVTRGWIGVSIQALTPELASSFGLKSPEGVLVSSVNPGEPADKAGMKAGDVIVSFAGKPIGKLHDLPRAVAATKPGSTVKVKVIRDGKPRTLFVTVARRSDTMAGVAGEEKERGSATGGKLGLSVEPITPEIARRLNLPDTDGVVISSVSPDSPARAAGLRRGDVIREINRQPIRGVTDFNRVMQEAARDDVILFLLKRRGSTLYVVMKLKD